MIDGISVVICCYNSAPRISQVLSHLLRQRNNQNVEWEVVIVDNASTDNTKEVANEVWNHPSVPMRIVDEPVPGLSNARRRGLEAARFEIVSFIDDDNLVEERWVEKVFGHMNANPDVAILGGRGIARFDEPPPEWFPRFQEAYAVGPQATESGPIHKSLYGAGMNLRKEIWSYLIDNNFEFILSDRTGSSLSSGGDSELCLAVLLAGYQLYYKHDLTFFHLMPASRIHWDYLVKLYHAFGRSGPVAAIYHAFISKRKSSLRNTRCWLSSLFNASFNLMSSIPGYLKFSFSNKEGSREYIRYVYCREYLAEDLRLAMKYKQLLLKIKEASWRSK